MSSDFDHIGSVVLNPFMTKVVVTETLQVNVSDPPSHGVLKTSSSRRVLSAVVTQRKTRDWRRQSGGTAS